MTVTLAGTLLTGSATLVAVTVVSPRSRPSAADEASVDTAVESTAVFVASALFSAAYTWVVPITEQMTASVRHFFFHGFILQNSLSSSSKLHAQSPKIKRSPSFRARKKRGCAKTSVNGCTLCLGLAKGMGLLPPKSPPHRSQVQTVIVDQAVLLAPVHRTAAPSQVSSVAFCSVLPVTVA